MAANLSGDLLRLASVVVHLDSSQNLYCETLLNLARCFSLAILQIETDWTNDRQS